MASPRREPAAAELGPFHVILEVTDSDWFRDDWIQHDRHIEQYNQ